VSLLAEETVKEKMSSPSKWQNVRQKFSLHSHGRFIDNRTFSINLGAELCVRLLSTSSVQNFSGLKTKLKSSSREWIEEFLIFGGMEVLFEGLRRLSGRKLAFVDAFLQLECVNCIKEVMNSEAGLNYIVNDTQFSRNLVKG
jgi:hypothetical protein